MNHHPIHSQMLWCLLSSISLLADLYVAHLLAYPCIFFLLSLYIFFLSVYQNQVFTLCFIFLIFSIESLVFFGNSFKLLFLAALIWVLYMVGKQYFSLYPKVVLVGTTIIGTLLYYTLYLYESWHV